MHLQYMSHTIFPLPLFCNRLSIAQKGLDFVKSAKGRNSYLAPHKPAKVEQRVNLDWFWPSVTLSTRILDRNLSLIPTGIYSTAMGSVTGPNLADTSYE